MRKQKLWKAVVRISLLISLLWMVGCKKEETQDSGGFPEDTDGAMATDMGTSEDSAGFPMGTDEDSGGFPADSGFGQ